MNTDQIDTAFGMLLEEFERAIAESNERGVAAFGRKDYGAVTALAEHAAHLVRFQDEVAAIEALWNEESISLGEGVDTTDTEPAAEDQALAPAAKQRKQAEFVTPSDFHAECVRVMEGTIGAKLSRKSRSALSNEESSIGIVCLVSRLYKKPDAPFFWFSVHPYQLEFLETYSNGQLVLGCGSPDLIFAIPHREFEPLCRQLNTSESDGRLRYHIHIIGEPGGYYMCLKGRNERVKISKYQVTCTSQP